MAKKSKKKPAPKKSPNSKSGKSRQAYGDSSSASDAFRGPSPVTVEITDVTPSLSGMIVVVNIEAEVTVDTNLADADGDPRVIAYDTNNNQVADEALEYRHDNVWGKNNFAPGILMSGITYLFMVVQNYTLKPIPGSASDTEFATVP